MSICLECKEQITSRWGKKFCSRSCSAKFNNRKRVESGWKHSEDSKANIRKSVLKSQFPKVLVDRKFIHDIKVKRICPFCNKEYEDSAYKPKNRCDYKDCRKHRKHLRGRVRVNGKFILDIKVDKICPKCSKQFKASIYKPQKYCKGEECKKQRGYPRTKGCVKVNGKFVKDIKIKKICPYCNKTFKASIYKPKNNCNYKSCKESRNTTGKGKIKVDGIFVKDIKVKKPCPYCGEEFIDSIYRPNGYCKSDQCKRKHLLATRKNPRRSKAEIYLQKLLSGVFDDVKGSDRTVLGGKQIDVVLKNHKIAIEWDGVFHRKLIYGQGMLDFIQQNDKTKTKSLLKIGWKIIRVKDDNGKTAPREFVQQKFKEIVNLVNKGFTDEILI